MKLYLIDELYEYLKDDPEFQEIYRTISDNYYADSIELELKIFYDLRNRKDVRAYFDKMTEKIKETNLDLYKIIYYSTTDISLETLTSMLQGITNEKEQLLILDKILTYGMNDGIYYKYISMFCYIYENYKNKSELPKYIHVTYYEIYAYNLYYSYLKNKTHTFSIADYNTFMDDYKKLKTDLQPYIVSTDTINNDFLEIQASYLCLLENKLSTDDMQEIITTIDTDVEKLDFDNKYYSMGVIWLFEEIAEVYLNNKDYNNFFLMLYKIFRYTDNALADLTQLFNGLRYYNKFNIYSFATSIIRLNHLKNLFQNKLNFKLINLKLSDEIFLNSDNFISKSRFNYTFDKLTLSKYNKYIERWLIAHEDELVELSSNTAVIEDAKRVINDYISTLE